MANPPEKALSTKQLQQRMRELLDELEVDNAWLNMGKIIEQQPVAERIKKLLDIRQKLHARKVKLPPLDIRAWHPVIVGELELDPRVARWVEQQELKAALLKKHGGRRLPKKPKTNKRRRLLG